MIKRLLHRLRYDERGSAMTEFTICLPAFLILFVGITELGQLEEAGLQVQLRANKEMWGNAIPVQKTMMDIVHQSPQLAALQGGAQVLGNTSEYPVADFALGGSYLGLGFNGTEGEAEVSTLVGGVAAVGPGAIFGSEPEPDFFAEDVFNDRFMNPLPFAGGALTLWNAVQAVPPTPFIVPRQAIAAGNRYGQEEGAHSMTHNTIWGSHNLSADYRVQVAPRPVQALGFTDFIPIGYSRLGAEEYDCFKEVLGINWSQPFIGCEFMPPFYWSGPSP